MLMVKFVTVEQIAQVREMFAARPIMSKMYISWQTKIPNEKLKYILPLLSYYYTTGPWRIMWVRYGYDPRRDFDSRYLQQLDFRVRFYVSANSVLTVDRKRSAFKGRRKRELVGELGEPKLEYPFFDHDAMPKSRACIIYQFCDIRVPRVQEMLDKIPSPLSGAVCNEKSGWLPANFDEQCRTIMVDIVRGLAKAQRELELETAASSTTTEAMGDGAVGGGGDGFGDGREAGAHASMEGVGDEEMDEYEEDDMYDDEMDEEEEAMESDIEDE